MKVQNEESAININEALKGQATKATHRKMQQENASGVDEVKLSSRAREFQGIKDVLETVQVDREEKVAALRDSVENKTYSADTRKVAENLINESLIDLFA
jgi:flagellar biosynthesis anti-sigma factor FlgM